MSCILKRLRELNGYSKEALAKKIGISSTTISNYENGKCKPSRATIKKFAKLFEVDNSCFIEDRIPQEPTYEVLQNNPKQNEEKEMRISIPQNNMEKFKQVFLYILTKVGAKPNVGQTVLCKLLYFIDFCYYELYGKEITEIKYTDNGYGTYPVGFKKIVDKMVQDGMLEVIHTTYINKNQTKYRACYAPDLWRLSIHEINHIDNILEAFSDMTATELSNISHKDIHWIPVKEDSSVWVYPDEVLESSSFSKSLN
jgi:transcriptional regulator with XRE-family HTH domain